jgi:hypothetical protein
MKKSILFGMALAFVGGTASADTARPEFVDSPDPDEIHIEELTYNGTGCAPGSAAVDIAPDGTAFTLIFSDFVAQAGPGIPLAQSRKNCQVNMTMHVPHGFTYAIASVDYRGYASISRGATGLQKAIYYFQGQSPQASTERSFRGPYDADWTVSEDVDVASLVWAPCGERRSVNINAQVRINKGTSTGESFMTQDSEDGSIRQIYHVVWARCPSR